MLKRLSGYDFVWLVYGREPGSLPRSWRGLVGHKRLDVVVRVLLAALYPCGSVSRGSLFALFLDRGSEGESGRLVLLGPDCLPPRAVYEHEIGGFFLQALRGDRCSSVNDVSLLYVVRALKRNGYHVIGFREGAKYIDPSVLSGRAAVILGSFFDPPPRALREASSVYSIGPYSYLASHVAAFINAVRLGFIRLQQAYHRSP